MNQKQIRAAVEAMLFASGDPIGADKLAQAVQLPQLSVEAALEALRERYTREDSGLCLLHLNTRWQLATKTEWADCVRRVLDRFIWLQFDELRILPDFGSGQPAVEDRVSFRVSAQALFIVIAAVRVLYEFWRKKVLDIFL